MLDPLFWRRLGLDTSLRQQLTELPGTKSLADLSDRATALGDVRVRAACLCPRTACMQPNGTSTPTLSTVDSIEAGPEPIVGLDCMAISASLEAVARFRGCTAAIRYPLPRTWHGMLRGAVPLPEQAKLLRGVLPSPAAPWPAEPFRSGFLAALNKMEMPRFTRRYPQLLDPLLRQMLSLVHVRGLPWPQSLLGIHACADVQHGVTALCPLSYPAAAGPPAAPDAVPRPREGLPWPLPPAHLRLFSCVFVHSDCHPFSETVHTSTSRQECCVREPFKICIEHGAQGSDESGSWACTSNLTDL